LDKPHILALAAETGFLLFKEQVLLKFKKEISAVQCERKPFRLISLLTPVNFHWTVPLTHKNPLVEFSMNICLLVSGFKKTFITSLFFGRFQVFFMAVIVAIFFVGQPI
jgi:hypothetical protein